MVALASFVGTDDDEGDVVVDGGGVDEGHEVGEEGVDDLMGGRARARA